MSGPKNQRVAQAWADTFSLPVTSPAVLRLSEATRTRHLVAGDVLIEQGAMSREVFLLLEGNARAARFSENGHEIWLSDLLAGDLVGETAPIIEAPRTSAVIASEPLRVAWIAGTTFMSLIDEEPKLAQSLVRILAVRLKRTSDRLVEQVALGVAQRLYGQLVRLAVPSASDSEVFLLERCPTMNELGQRIHSSREAAQRAMAQLKKKGLVRKGTTPRQLLVIVPNSRREANEIT